MASRWDCDGGADMAEIRARIDQWKRSGDPTAHQAIKDALIHGTGFMKVGWTPGPLIGYHTLSLPPEDKRLERVIKVLRWLPWVILLGLYLVSMVEVSYAQPGSYRSVTTNLPSYTEPSRSSSSTLSLWRELHRQKAQIHALTRRVKALER